MDPVVLVVGGMRFEVTEDQADELRRQLGLSRSEVRLGAADEILTPDEAAPLMRHSAKTVRELCRLRRDDPRYLKHLRKGPKILIRRADVSEWIANQIGGGE